MVSPVPAAPAAESETVAELTQEPTKSAILPPDGLAFVDGLRNGP
jgi:hypothetical protein